MLVRICLWFNLVVLVVGTTSAEWDTEVAGIGIVGANNHAYVWYRDYFVSSGIPTHLDAHRTPYNYVPTTGKPTTSIVAMAIAKSNSHVYTWYSDGTVTEGTSRVLDAYRAPRSFSLPHSWQTTKNIVGISISSADHVFAWYDDCTYSEGTSTNLDAYAKPIRYTLAPGYGPQDVLDMATSGSNQMYVWYKTASCRWGPRTI